MTTLQKYAILVLVLSGLIVAIIWSVEIFSKKALLARYTLPAQALAVMPSPSAVNEGSRLAHVDGCYSCHGADLAGRIVYSGWFGTQIAAPNLTRIESQETDAQLAAAIRYGVKHDGTSVIDMPSNQLIKSSDSDIAAIISYLRTLPVRPDAAGKTQWRFGGRIMLATGLLPAVAPMVNNSARGPLRTPTSPLALGRYITQSHCSVCHGPDLSGETIISSPDLRISIQHYSLATFDHFFRTGVGQIGHGTRTMTKIIRSRFRYLNPADVRAIYVYLKSDGGPA